jgi:hypothetical protein
MKKLLVLVLILFCGASVRAQNIEGQIIASQYGRWKVPGYAANTYSSFAPTSCRVQGGASFFFAFSVGTPVAIVDGNPSLNETVMPTSTVESDVTCAVSIAPVNNHQLPFYLASATGGLQEALNQNLTAPQTNTIILDNAFYQLVGGASNAAAVIFAAQGSSNLGLVDVTQVPTVWYQWNGSHYVKVGNGGVGTGLNTLVNDLVSNSPTNNGAQDLYDFVATGPTVYSPQSSVNAAAASNGSVILQPGVGRTPFTNTGNYRVQDNRTDVPATARGATEFGAVCDTREVYGTFAAASTTVTLTGGSFSAADVGRDIVYAFTAASPPTQFESSIVSITDSQHAVMTTAAPFTAATAHEITLGHDDTAAITQGMTAVGGGGTLVFPAGVCMTHTQILRGQSPIGLGNTSQIVGFPGEDIFQAPDPSAGGAVNQGAAHIHDLTFLVDSRIDATQPWQTVNDAGTTAHAAMYRPVAQLTGVSSNPMAPGWFQGAGPNNSGAYNGVANITAASAVMCVPSTETAPAVGQTVVFPYLTSVFTAAVSSTAGSCSGGASPRTLSAALPSGSTNSQAEWFAGSSPQNLSTSISSGSCPSTITLSNSINPVPGYESNVAPFGMVQIDAEQFTYFGKSNAQNPSPVNTLYGVQCAQNGTTRAAHSAGATVVPLNQLKPAYPWPVTPTVNTSDTTPSGTAGFFPGWNVGNAAFAFPLATGISASYGSTGAWNANAKIENLSFYPWPNEINGEAWSEVNHTAMMYFVNPSYASVFANLYSLYLFYGITMGPPSIENGNYASAQPTGDGTHWDGITIYAANPIIIPLGNQNSFANFNVYSQEQSTAGAGLGADTCFYFTALYNDQTGAIFDALSLDHFKNMYCEPEGGAHAGKMPQWEWDTYNSEIEDQHMGGGGEVYIGGQQQHWIGGNFNNAVGTPAINWGTQNTADFVANLGSEPKGNVYGTNSLINFGWGSRFSGTTAQAFSTPTGPFGGLQMGNAREPIPSQTAETFFTGNLTEPYPSLDGGLITPEEFNASFAFEAQAMSVGWTYDSTSPVTDSFAACNVGNNPATIYCATSKFNQESIPIGPGQRLVPGKYTLYVSMKDAATATNTETMSIFSNCASYSESYNIPITNAWPVGLSQFFSVPVDFSSMVGSSGCALGVRFLGATTADQIQVGFFDFAPVAESLNAQTINASTLNTPGSGTGGTPTGCAQSPVTGINGGYTCPTKGNQTALTANQTSSQTTAQVSSTSGFSSSGCFFVDGEYECYSSIVDGTHFGGVTRAAYVTTAASHNSGAVVVGVSLVLGSVQQPPTSVVAYGSSEPPIVTVNNGFPFNHGGASVFSINNGGNETWVDTGGAIHQLNSGAINYFEGPLEIGTNSGIPEISSSGNVLQTFVPNTAYSPQTLGGGHAGSFNVITTANITAPTITNFAATGSTTISYVCAGTDFDGNLIPGTTASITNGPASGAWAYPLFIQAQCPWVAGVNTYQIYRTAGGQNQGLVASGSGPGFSINDFNGSSSGGTPPASNGSNPHISVAGSGSPTITMGSITISSGTGAPASTCGTAPNGSGSLWLRTDGSTSTSVYSCAGTTWTAVTIP